jgi:ankyrin repeat protein
MLACQKGFLTIVEYLIEQGAKVEGRDRFKRTPLIHACMYGNAHVVSYLLRRGANAKVFDSSSNTALHYAIAYGWYFCVRLLFEAGASIDCRNCWQTTCFEAGFSKGHYGICDYLLSEHGADINFKTDEGLTLVMITVDLKISSSAVQQLEYVVDKHKADCTCLDINGRNAFHYLALNQSAQKTHHSNEKEEQNFEKRLFRMAQLLFDYQCNPLQRDNKAQTPLMLALQSKNSLLVNFLIHQAKLPIDLDVNHDGKTLLHYFAMHCDSEQLIRTLLILPVTDQMRQMGQMIDNQGRTPFHYCAQRYDQYCAGDHSKAAVQEKYQWIIHMIKYCLQTIECDPDFPINSTEETSIFHLLRTTSYNVQPTKPNPLELYLDKSKNINILHHQTRRTPLLEAIHLAQYKTVDILLRQSSCDINLATSVIQEERLKTPLILACQRQYLSIVRDLLNHPQCDLLAYDEQKNQAFHYYLATAKRSDEYLEIFHLFMEKLKLIGNTDILNSRGKSDCTPLHITVQHNLGTVDSNYDVERTLINSHCNPLLKDNLGNLPLHNVFLTNKGGNDPV